MKQSRIKYCGAGISKGNIEFVTKPQNGRMVDNPIDEFKKSR
jgi:hypothetical protein